MGSEVLRPRSENPDQHYSSRKKQWYTLPEGVGILLTPRQRETLDFIIQAGEQGKSRNTLAQGDIGKGMDPDIASANVGNSIKQVNGILSNTAGAGRIISEIVNDGDAKKGRPALMHTYKPHKEDRLEQAGSTDPNDPSQDLHLDRQASEKFPTKTRGAESKIKNTEQIIGAYSVFQALLNLAQGTLDQIPQDVEEHLDKTLKTALEKKIIESNIIKGLPDIFRSPSKERLERFFQVNFSAALELWELKAEEAVTEEDKDFVQVFERLKDQRYTKEKIVKEVLADHFGLEIPDKSTPTNASVSQSPKDTAHFL